MIIRLIIFLFALSTPVCFAQKQVTIDTSFVEERSFNAKEINEIKKNKDFQYDRYKEPPKSLWDRFWSWVWFKIKQLLSTKGGRTSVWSLLIILAVAIISFFVFKVMGIKEGGMFGRRSKENLNYSISSDDIHGISFEEAIENAIASSNFRLAVRLLYLQSLKKLSDRGYIEWQLNKTNIDYLQETKEKAWHSLFSSLTYNFEYTWYGEATVNKEKFQVVQQQFHQFNNQL
jgi:hypothetical protein